MQRKLLLLSLKRLALLPKSSKKAIIRAFYDVFAKPRSVTYDKYAPSRELAKNLENPSNSRLFRREFFLGLMVAFLQCVIRNNRGPHGILCTRGAYGHLLKVGFFYFVEDTCVFGAFVLVFF